MSKELLERKEAMIGEIHHRVKNNLQLVASMLALQSHQTDNDANKTIFNASRSRVESMSLIHQKLYQNMDYENVNVQEYFTNLAEQILKTYPNTQTIEPHFNIKTTSLHIDTIVPIGLILNEWLTNSIKYAFEAVDDAKISMEMVEEGGKLKVSYFDNGVGLSNNTLEGFGSQLIKSLGRQLRATFVQHDSHGYGITMYIEKYSRVA